MDYIHHELELAEGEAVEVTFDARGTPGGGVNVQLLDGANYELYRQRKPFRYRGGFYAESPAVLSPPEPGRWHLVIDLGGGPGRVRASARVLSPQPA